MPSIVSCCAHGPWEDGFNYLMQTRGQVIVLVLLGWEPIVCQVDLPFANFFLSKLLGKTNYLDELPSLDKDLHKNLTFLKVLQHRLAAPSRPIAPCRGCPMLWLPHAVAAAWLPIAMAATTSD